MISQKKPPDLLTCSASIGTDITSIAMTTAHACWYSPPRRLIVVNIVNRIAAMGLRYIIEVNKRGRYFPEFYASLLLRRMLSERPIGYVDLRSPAGNTWMGRVWGSKAAVWWH